MIIASLNSYHKTLQLMVHLMLDVGALALPCLLCWLPDLLSHHAGRSRTMGFCCFSLKGLMRVVLLSMMGKNKENRAHVENNNGNFQFITVDVLTMFKVTWFYRSFFTYPILAQQMHIFCLKVTFQLFFSNFDGSRCNELISVSIRTIYDVTQSGSDPECGYCVCL